MSGPIPKPRKLRLLDGTAKRAKPSPKRPKTRGIPSPPATLTGSALAEWRRVVPLLHAEGLLSRLDRGLLTAYCTTWARLLDAQAALGDGAPMTTQGSHGGTQARVEIRIARDASAALVRLADALGLSPASRARLGTGQEPEPATASWLPPELRGDNRKENA